MKKYRLFLEKRVYLNVGDVFTYIGIPQAGPSSCFEQNIALLSSTEIYLNISLQHTREEVSWRYISELEI